MEEEIPVAGDNNGGTAKHGRPQWAQRPMKSRHEPHTRLQSHKSVLEFQCSSSSALPTFSVCVYVFLRRRPIHSFVIIPFFFAVCVFFFRIHPSMCGPKTCDRAASESKPHAVMNSKARHIFQFFFVCVFCCLSVSVCVCVCVRWVCVLGGHTHTHTHTHTHKSTCPRA